MPTINAVQLLSSGLGFIADGTAADVGGDQVASRKDLILSFQNEDTSLTTVTIATPGKTDGNEIEELAVAVPASDSVTVVLKSGIYTDATGFVQLTYSSVTSLTVIATYV